MVAKYRVFGHGGGMSCDMNANRRLGKVGLIGMAVCVAVNVTAILVFKKNSAEFFSPSWWPVFWPAYTPWLVFCIIGLTSLGKGKDKGSR